GVGRTRLGRGRRGAARPRGAPRRVDERGRVLRRQADAVLRPGLGAGRRAFGCVGGRDLVGDVGVVGRLGRRGLGAAARLGGRVRGRGGRGPGRGGARGGGGRGGAGGGGRGVGGVGGGVAAVEGWGAG